MPADQPPIIEQLMPQGFRNAAFDDNLAFFKANHKDIYEKVSHHKPDKYRLCINPDGSPNIIYMPSQQLVYPITAEEIEANDSRKVSEMSRAVILPADQIGRGGQNFRGRSPIQVKAYERLFESSILKVEEHTDVDGASNLQVIRQDPNYLPFIRAYGVGLGTHFFKIAQDLDVLFLSVIEPEIDLFYSSLFVISWRDLFDYFSGSGKEISLNVGNSLEHTRVIEDNFIAGTFPYMTSNFARLQLFSGSKNVAELIAKERERDAVLSNRLSSGWYEDQRAGLYNSLLNIRSRLPIYTGGEVGSFLRIFVVGSGPSLDAALQTIRRHADDAIIVACGSAIVSLLEAGIIPDFHVWQERVLLGEFLKAIPDKTQLKKIRLLKLNVVSPKSDELYKKTYVFQKANDPGSCLLGADFPAVQGVNPTVTNAGIAFASELGADEVYLFGVDYGSPLEHGKWHARNSAYDSGHTSAEDYAKEESFEIEGNFGRKIVTTTTLQWSLSISHILIAKAQHIKWFNVGYGALIKGVEVVDADHLPTLNTEIFHKNTAIQALDGCFSQDYDPSSVEEDFSSRHRKSVDDYLESLRVFVRSKPTSRDEIISVLRGFYQAIDAGKGQPDFMPNPLLSGGIKKLILNIYLQITLADSDKNAVIFFNQAAVVIEFYFQEICEDLDNLFLRPESDFDLWH